jgi:hypothetical protein
MTAFDRQLDYVTRDMKADEGDFFDQSVRDALENALRDRMKGKAWSHAKRHNIWRRLKHGEYPLLRDAEDAAATYLAKAQRSSTLDRLLIDLLLAAELFAFAEERKFGAWFMAGLLACITVTAYRTEPNGNYALWLFAAIICWQMYRSVRLLNTMIATYSAMDGRVVSVRRLRVQIELAAAKGVVWPTTLYALLDDIERRTSRL